MNIAILALGVAYLILATWVYLTTRRIDKLFDKLSAMSLDEGEFRKELKREMSKLHGYCEGNAKSVLLASRSLEATKEDLTSLRDEMAELEKKQEEFEQLADESVRAQIESEKAWADGVRAITGYGANIPALNLKGIEHG